MQPKESCFTYNLHHHPDSLPEEDRHLLLHASECLPKAHAPYSMFRVAAAIRAIHGSIVSGTNQENSAFPVGQCAERVALYRYAHELGRVAIDTIAILVDHEEQMHPASPCGACRQLLAEFSSFQENHIRLLLKSTRNDQVIEVHNAMHLLPLAFDGKFLGV